MVSDHEFMMRPLILEPLETPSQSSPFGVPPELISRALTLASWFVSSWSVLVGGLILAAGPDRIATSPPWRFVMMSPVGSHIVGSIFLATGLVALCGMALRSGRLVGTCLLLVGAWSIITGTFLAAGSIFSETGGVLGGPAWYFIGFIYTIMGALLRRTQ